MVSGKPQDEPAVARDAGSFQELVRKAPFGICVATADLRVIAASESVRQAFAKADLTGADLTGADLAALLHAVWPAPFAQGVIGRFRHTLATGEPYADRNTIARRTDRNAIEAYDWRIERITLPDSSTGIACYFYNLSELRRTEAELRASEQLLAALFRQAPSFMALLRGPGHVIEMANDAYIAVIGGRDVIGRTVADALPELAGQGYLGILDRVYRTGETYVARAAPYAPLAASGEALPERYVDFIYQPTTDAAGAITGIFVEGFDVTSRIEAETRLRGTADTFYCLVQNAPFGIYVVDADFRMAEASFSTRRTFGIENLAGMDFAVAVRAIWPEPFAGEVIARFRHTLDTGEKFASSDMLEKRADRERREAYDWQIERIAMPDGRHGVVCYFYDLTERRALEAALRESEERYRFTVEGARDYAIVTLDAQGMITGWNTGAERLLGYTEAEAIGQPGAIFFGPEDREAGAPAAEMQRARTQGSAENERWHIRKDGARFWGSGLIMPLGDDAQRGYVMIFRDTTAAHEAEKELARFRAFSDHAADAHCVFDRGGRVVYANAAALQQLGYTEAEFIGMTIADFDQLWSVERFQELLAEIPAGPAPVPLIESLHRRKDGTVFPVEISVSIVEQEGEPLLSAVIRNLSERQEAGAALARAAEHFRTLADNISQFAWMTEPDGWVFWYNRRWFEYTGTTLAQMQGWGWQGVHHPDYVQRVTAKFKSAIASETDWEDTFPLRGADGQYRWFLSRATPIRDGSDRITRWFGTNTDITDRIESAERQSFALRLSDTLRPLADTKEIQAVASRMVGETLHAERAAYSEFDEAEGTLTIANDYASPGVPPLTGCYPLAAFAWAIAAHAPGKAVIVGNTQTTPVIPGDQRDAVLALQIGALLSAGVFRNGRLVATLGIAMIAPRAWTQAEADLVADTAERAWSAVERVRAEAATRESDERYRMLFNSLDAGFCTIEVAFGENGRAADYRFVEVNPAFENHTGLKDAAGKWMRTLAPQHEQHWFDIYGMIALTGQAKRFESHAAALGRWYDVHAFRVGPFTAHRVAILFNDITARKQAEDILARDNAQLERLVTERTRELAESQARLAHAQRMEALGQLAGGVAHDFNNVLQAVQGGARLIETRPEDAGRVRRLAAMIADAAGRGAAVTRRLLAFSRRADLHAEPVDAGDLLAGLREILTHTLGSGIDVRVQVPASLPPLFADKSQLETVLINLAANARDAMGGAGAITLSAAPETIAQADVASLLKPGSYVRLAVADTGSGMEPEVLERASDPFFTTKPHGQGTGLGLPMARGFAEQSGGALAINSAPGRGTTVHLWLPVAAAEPAGTPPMGERAAAPAARARVLLVDDEPVVREITAQQLEAAGYDVLPVGSSERALELLDLGTEVDLIVSDLSMPGMDGLSLIRAAQRKRPGLPAILLTGYATDATELAVGGATTGSFSLLRKPIEAKQLAERVAVLLEGASAGQKNTRY